MRLDTRDPNACVDIRLLKGRQALLRESKHIIVTTEKITQIEEMGVMQIHKQRAHRRQPPPVTLVHKFAEKGGCNSHSYLPPERARPFSDC